MSIERLREWVERTSGLPTVWMHQNAPRPERSFIGIQQMLRRRIGHEEITDVDGDGYQYVIGNREYQISINAFTENEFHNPLQAVDILAHLQDMSNVPPERDWLYWNNVNILRQHKIQPLPRIISEGYQLKASWDVVVLCRESIRFKQDWIESVGLSGVGVSSGLNPLKVTKVTQRPDGFILRGRALVGARVCTVDGNVCAQADKAGAWELDISPLPYGSHTLSVTDGSAADFVHVTLRQPELKITVPVEGAEVPMDVTAHGLGQPTSWIEVNGKRTYVNAHGEWACELELEQGPRVIHAEDGQSKVEINVSVH